MPKSQFQAPQLLERARRVLRAPPPSRARPREGLPRRAGPLLPREVAQSPQPRQGEGREGEVLRGSVRLSLRQHIDFRHRDDQISRPGVALPPSRLPVVAGASSRTLGPTFLALLYRKRTKCGLITEIYLLRSD